MWYCNSDRFVTARRSALVLGAFLSFALALSCQFNNGRNTTPQGFDLVGMGPYEPAPFEVCFKEAQVRSEYLALAVPTGTKPPACVVNSDCPARTECHCGFCVPRACGSFEVPSTCGLDKCADGRCLSVCVPGIDEEACDKKNGEICSPKLMACVKNCAADSECNAGERCLDSSDGKVCGLQKLSESAKPAEGYEKLVIRLGRAPSSPSGAAAGDEVFILFSLELVGDADYSAAVYAAKAGAPEKDWKSFYLKMESLTPLFKTKNKYPQPKLAAYKGSYYVFYNEADGSVAFRKAAAPDGPYGEPVSIIAQSETLYPFSPAAAETKDGLKLFFASNNSIYEAESTDETLTSWKITDQPVLTTAMIETHGGVELDPCAFDKNCGSGLYCYIRQPEENKMGICIPDSCDACDGDKLFCYEQRICLCKPDGCPTPNPQPVWVEVGSVEYPAPFYIFDRLFLYFSARGRSTMGQYATDFSAGAAVLIDGAYVPLLGNPLFDRTFLNFHYEERSPFVLNLPKSASIIMFYIGDGQLKAGRCPPEPLFHF